MLTTKRLVLTPWSEQDHGELVQLFEQEHVQRYLTGGEPVTPAWVAKEIGASVARAAQGQLAMYTARLRQGGFVGFTGFWTVPPTQRLEPVYALDRSCLRQGLATEMAHAMLDLAFARGVEVVHASVDWPNVAGALVLERLGMEPKGSGDGPRHKLLYFEMSRARWQGQGRIDPREA